jgi:hypothetical protein
MCGPTAYSRGDARNRATLTSFNDFKTRYLGISLMHFGISKTPTFTGTIKWRWLTNEIRKFAKKHEERLLHHVNVEAIQLLDISELMRKLKKPPF